MKHKTANLAGAQLNAAVAIADGYKYLGAVGTQASMEGGSTPRCLCGGNGWWLSPEGFKICGPCTCFPWDYCSDWSLVGPIIGRERISVYQSDLGDWSGLPQGWLSNPDIKEPYVRGPTPLIAAMRAYVASKLGEEVDLP